MDSPRTVSVLPSDLSPDEMYLLLRDSVLPRPIAWVSTIDAQGRTNLAPFSFFTVCSADPPVIGLSIVGRGLDPATGQWRANDTLTNVRSTRELVVNLVPQALLDQMVETSAPLPHGDSEFTHAGLQPVPSVRVRPPRVAGVPLALECTLFSILDIGRDSWVMGRVEHIHIDDRVHLGELKGQKHRVDLMREPALTPVGRLGRADYVRLDEHNIIRRDRPKA